MGDKELKVVRKNIVANTIEEFKFNVVGFKFLVNNFTDGDIYVAFKLTNDINKMLKIPKDCGRVCIINESPASDNFSDKVYVFSENIDENKEVEIQCLKF